MTTTQVDDPTQYIPQYRPGGPVVNTDPDPGLSAPYPGSEPRPKRPRIPGFRLKRVPSGNLLGQLAMAAMGDVGLYQVAGLGVTLLVTGVIGVVVFALREADIL